MKIWGLIIGIVLASCVQHSVKDTGNSFFPEPANQVSINYAKGFEVIYEEGQTILVSKSLEGNDYFNDSLYLIHQKEEVSQNKALFSFPTSINCQSSTHLAYIHFFDAIKKVSGLCGMNYVHEGEILDALKEAEVKEVCLGESVQLESVLSTAVDLFLVYPFSKSDADYLTSNGVKTFMIAEYLEKEPLARLEWIKLFGVLFGQEEAANEYFNKVELEYNSLVQSQPDTNKRFIFNLPYGDSWYTPSANSLVVQLLEDAGLYYYYQGETGTENTTHGLEEVWNNGTDAEYWVIIANRPKDFSLEDLILENPVYSTFKSVIHHQVIFCNSATSDYFLTGVIEPELMLKDLLFATHKMDQHEPKYFQLLK